MFCMVSGVASFGFRAYKVRALWSSIIGAGALMRKEFNNLQ